MVRALTVSLFLLELHPGNPALLELPAFAVVVTWRTTPCCVSEMLCALVWPLGPLLQFHPQNQSLRNLQPCCSKCAIQCACACFCQVDPRVCDTTRPTNAC